MAELGTKLGVITPEKSAALFFGSKISTITVYQYGIEVDTNKGIQSYHFSTIEKITAKNYAKVNPTSIFINIQIKNSLKIIDFTLLPNKKDVNLLLDIFCDYQLGKNFPKNLNELDLDLGGLGISLRLQNGVFILGKDKIPLTSLQEFTTNPNGYYELAFKGSNQKVSVSPDCAPNILTSIKVLTIITVKNVGLV